MTALARLLWPLLLLASCRGDSVTKDAGPPADGAAATVTAKGTLVENLPGEPPLTSGRLCLVRGGAKTDTCVALDAKGTFSVAIPRATETGLLFDAAGYGPTYFPLWATADVDMGSWRMEKLDALVKLYAAAGLSSWRTGTGLLVVNAAEGASFTIKPAGGKGPYYGNATTLDPTLTAMTAARYGLVLDLDPGVYEVQVTSPRPCKQDVTGWPAATATVRIPVLAGYGSPAALSCP